METTAAEHINVDVVENQSLSSESGGILAIPMLLLILGLALFIAFSMALSYYFFISYRDLLTRGELETATVQEWGERKALKVTELNSYGVHVVPAGESSPTDDVFVRMPIEQGIKKVLVRYQQ